ncbi:MAG TPA: ANTAR domain-containing protein [Microlunatus sp.]|nr:ANTAR domain-containing protein [Microlunatus sp.]
MTPAEVQLVSRFSGRVSGPIGRFTGRREPDRWIWDDVAGALLARPVHDRSTGLEVLLDQVPAAEQGLLTDAIAAAVPGTPFTVSCQLRSATGECRSVLILMEALEEAPAQFVAIRPSVMEDLMAGAGWWIVGYLIDVTQLRLRAARQAGAHAVERAVEHRAVIEQAKGMLMLTERLDADAAFAVLAQRSQAANTKLHLVAAELVAEFAAHGCAADARERLSACGGEWPLNRD